MTPLEVFMQIWQERMTTIPYVETVNSQVDTNDLPGKWAGVVYQPDTRTLQNGQTSWMVQSNDQLKRAKDYKPLIVAYNDGAPVRLSDVADVQDSYSNIYNAGSFNGKPSVLLVIFRQPGANIIATVDRIVAAMPFLQASLPPSIKLEVGLDRTTTVRA